MFSCVCDEECALEDEVFEDGAETRMECNKCVCACGNWVCTALTCTGEDLYILIIPFCQGLYLFLLLTAIICVSGEHQVEEDGEEGAEDEEMTEEEWSRRVAELNSLN